jgi:gliding motility-associated lipoprotein GldD
MINLKLKFLVFGVIVCFSTSSCTDTPKPKPRAYFRIDLPEKEYKSFQSPCPFRFDIPKYSGIEIAGASSDSCRFNLVFPRQNAKIYFTYLDVNNDVSSYLNDAYQMAYSHEAKASSIGRERISNPNHDVYGIVFDLKGEVASSLQFYATDSSRHFLRGALYFNSSPNTDSIAPVLSFIREDVLHLLQSLEWESN